MAKVLIVSFDGLDYDLIQKYGLKNIRQKEFGKIDNQTNICVQVTSELFASFLTGTTWEEHGMVGLDCYKSPLLRKIESLNRYKYFRKFSGIRSTLYRNLPFVSSAKRHVDCKDLRKSTFLDKTNSEDIGVRAYSPGYNVDILQVMDRHGIEKAVEELDRFEEGKKMELWRALGEKDVVMVHFHKPDFIHHWYWEVGRMDKVKEVYEEVDAFAAEILNKAEENDFDTVIFMSDHGLPDVEKGGHNENAFYSCNHELFPDKTPHITDFHDEIIKEAAHEESIQELDI
jgi:hypothetical protein